ncbi:apontic [Holotrichia oblita]|uniref:Apontic n=1 Tax=Holotrichia oblita TaxID=644536 RepID=A0ACB9TIN9_HOLOL|nr:apontic [Holotrichia oblita]
MENKKRAANFSTKEECILVSLVKKYKHILENKKTDTVSNKKKIETWNNLANDFNSTCGEVLRDGKTLKSKYENLKKRTKEKFAAEKANIKKTGGGPHEEKKFTQLEYDVKELIGIQLTGTQSMFDDDRDTNHIEIVDHDYYQFIPNHAEDQVEIEITEESGQAHCQKNQLCSKVTQWANTKNEMADLQKACYLEEHNLKLELLKEAHAKEMKIKKRMLEMMEEKHEMEMNILKERIN